MMELLRICGFADAAEFCFNVFTTSNIAGIKLRENLPEHRKSASRSIYCSQPARASPALWATTDNTGQPRTVGHNTGHHKT